MLLRVQKIGAELGARYILEGGVRKAGGKVRVTVQLIDAQTGHHIWAQKLDRDLEDIFAIQDEITRRIAATVVPELEKVETKRSAAKQLRNLNAWDCYLHGLSFLHEPTTQGNVRARSAPVGPDLNVLSVQKQRPAFIGNSGCSKNGGSVTLNGLPACMWYPPSNSRPTTRKEGTLRYVTIFASALTLAAAACLSVVRYIGLAASSAIKYSVHRLGDLQQVEGREQIQLLGHIHVDDEGEIGHSRNG